MAKDKGDENNLKISEPQGGLNERQNSAIKRDLGEQVDKPKNGVLERLNPFKNEIAGFIVVVLLFAIIVLTASLINNAKKNALKAAPVDDYSVIISRDADVKLTVNTQNVVTAQTALNESGAVLLQNLKFTEVPIDDAVTSIIKKFDEYGLLDESLPVKLGVYGISSREAFLDKSVELVDVAANSIDGYVEVYELTTEDRDFIEENYASDQILGNPHLLLENFVIKVDDKVTARLNAASELKTILASYNENKDEVIADMSEDVRLKICEYSETYDFALDFNPHGDVKYSEIHYYIKQLDDTSKYSGSVVKTKI